ncbi:hypothetical protein HK097_002432 [Rhizophlyctis rosea]|uniref:DNA-directed RNA polymerase III subunit RPC9 n=1 Tax=Rhizophlyctis rosea TaxID=64517 RepID=A0AAD5SIJ7_9FUNG|nr:hypothetical protein HK097_002432 [Rhizophlyctis rosea]
MEVVELRAALLSNAEVFQFLKDLENQRKDPALVRAGKVSHKEDGFQDLNTVEYEVLKYLDKTPCQVQTNEQIQEFLSKVQSLELTRGEKLMLINLRPKIPVQLITMIEDMAERLNETRQQELLDIIRETFPYEEEEPPAEVNGIHDDNMEE